MKQHKYIVLPIELITEIESAGLTKQQINKAKKLVNLMLNRAGKERLLLSEYIELPQNYLQKIFGKYHGWFKVLRELGIIESNDKYLAGSYSKSYRINPKLLTGNFKADSYEESMLHICSTEFNSTSVVQDLRQLSIDGRRLVDLSHEYASNICITDFKINHQINNDFFEFVERATGKRWMTTRDKAIQFAESKGMIVIKDKSNYYIDFADQFIAEKKNAIRFHYLKAIDKLSKGIWFANRNTTNNRLDTNMTNLCQLLTAQIMEDNDLCSLDLSNSQFAIFCYLYEQSNEERTLDYLRFKHLAISGKLYEEIAEVIELPSRREAKSLMFELFFSSHKYNPRSKQKLKQHFPTVVSFIDRYKKENGDSSFAIELQLKEAEIFIDNIYARIKSENLFCLTKHDSVIVQRKDRKQIEEIILNYFTEIGFEGVLKTESEEPKWVTDFRSQLLEMSYEERLILLSNLAA